MWHVHRSTPSPRCNFVFFSVWMHFCNQNIECSVELRSKHTLRLLSHKRVGVLSWLTISNSLCRILASSNLGSCTAFQSALSLSNSLNSCSSSMNKSKWINSDFCFLDSLLILQTSDPSYISPFSQHYHQMCWVLYNGLMHVLLI